jgi:hypothetical protein
MLFAFPVLKARPAFIGGALFRRTLFSFVEKTAGESQRTPNRQS